jgi:Polyketide cyclase / dehydrase and lipid transport
MKPRSVTESIEADVDSGTIFELLADPRYIPDWAPNFADEVTGDEGSGWRVTKNGELFGLRVVTATAARTVDYLREIAPGREGGAYIRVVPRLGGGSVVVMTLPVPPGGDLEIVTTVLKSELAALVRLSSARG